MIGYNSQLRRYSEHIGVAEENQPTSVRDRGLVDPEQQNLENHQPLYKYSWLDQLVFEGDVEMSELSDLSSRFKKIREDRSIKNRKKVHF